MRFRDLGNTDDVAAWVGDHITHVVESGARVLGVATGRSPLPVYRALIEGQGTGLVDLRECELVLLDEYVGLDRDDPRSFRNTIVRELAEPLGVSPKQVHAPDGNAHDLDAAGRQFDATIESLGGVSLQLLGIGRNGHIAFNEPGTPWQLGTHVADLSDTTRCDNAPVFGSVENVPRRALTQGIRTILQATEVLLIATGPHKRDAVQRLRDDVPNQSLPASALAFHANATVMTDLSARRSAPPTAPQPT